jgi:hypothetical protein
LKYAVLMYADPEQTRAMTEAELQEILRKHERIGKELLRSGELTGGAGLAHPEETSTLRLDADEVVASSGPLIETDEPLSAYYEIECANLGRAQEIAGRYLDHHVTAIEIRRIHDTVDERMDPSPT